MNEEKKVNANDEFFVGYLPTPPGQKRWLRALVTVTVVLTLAIGALIALQMRPSGRGFWDSERMTEHTGVLHVKPYIHLEEPDPRAVQSFDDANVLLVEEGKHGVRPSLKEYDGQRISITGHLIQRGTHRMLELSDDDGTKITRLSAGPPTATSGVGRGFEHLTESTIELRGEIIDPKCQWGAMKPGDGKTHKGCAALCLRGGIPPVFVVSGQEPTQAYVLVNEHGEGLTGDDLESVIKYVGEPVWIRGKVCRVDTLDPISLIVFRLEPGSIKR